MAKAGGTKKNGGVPGRTLYSRVSFLHQAAAFLSSVRQPQPQPRNSTTATSEAEATAADVAVSRSPLLGPQSKSSMSRRLAGDMRSVSLKTRIRLSPVVKQSICKFCDSVLVEGETCTSAIENPSRNGKKPWADVLVRKCHACQKERRYPISAKRPTRKTKRDVSVGDVHMVDLTEQKQHG
ncbi:RNAse P Rpr2/Rpp21/SNM1 subunit domain-containing protein [Bombardia bombarda]|uniref:RNAse P Rpr2/Rpp21/SNM1 subunit domain-containing protein n=1 Tax=Bombardia bombarda TaxID=252184 RepID=A0AA39WI11_9PEZI|nr:RNAse P Rpr2/Rpp21/SNM1 subunit domain-containing protein [Bombardia bombarda]